MSWWAIIRAVKGTLGSVVELVSEHPRVAGIAAAAILGGVGLFWLGRASKSPDIIERTRTDTVYAQRTIRETDTVTVTEPEVVTIYERDTTVIYRDTTINIPMELAGGFRVARPRPIDIDGREVTYTAYDPGTGRWTQQTYFTEPDVWAMDVGARVLGGGAWGMGPELGIRLRSWRLSGSYVFSPEGPIYSASVSYVF